MGRTFTNYGSDNAGLYGHWPELDRIAIWGCLESSGYEWCFKNGSHLPWFASPMKPSLSRTGFGRGDAEPLRRGWIGGTKSHGASHASKASGRPSPEFGTRCEYIQCAPISRTPIKLRTARVAVCHRVSTRTWNEFDRHVRSGDLRSTSSQRVSSVPMLLTYTLGRSSTPWQYRRRPSSPSTFSNSGRHSVHPSFCFSAASRGAVRAHAVQARP